jgi:short-subunit dehydrogenase
MPDLGGRVALVTGASSGIGAATARELARRGARVALFARRKDRLESVAGEIRRAGGEGLVVAGDVTEPATVRAAVGGALQAWGRVDLLVNNAGVGFAAPFEAVTAEELRRLMEVNLVGVLTATQAVLPVMRRQGRGHVINVASIAGRRGAPFRSAYNATKFALVGLSEALRLELRGSGIHVSLVHPILTESEFHRAEVRKVETRRVGPVQSAERVARAIARCARRPRPEVYPYPPARILAVLSVLAPGVTDWLIARFR